MSDSKVLLHTDAHVIWSIQKVRYTIAWIGILFPLVLLAGGLLFDREPNVPLFRDAISDYYYSRSLHYVFLVSLLALSALLIYYQYHAEDNIVTTCAGLFAMGVALFPPAPDGGPRDALQNTVDTLHHSCAVLFIASLAYVAVFLFMKPEAPLKREREWVAENVPPFSRVKWLGALLWSSDDTRKTLRVRTDEKWRRNKVYGVCGILIAICVVLLVAIDGFHLLWSSPPHTLTFWLETSALWSFAVAWLVKSEP